MTELTITNERVFLAFADRYNYEPTLETVDGKTVPNDETKLDFGKRMLKEKIEQMTKSTELDKIGGEDREAALADYQEVEI